MTLLLCMHGRLASKLHRHLLPIGAHNRCAEAQAAANAEIAGIEQQEHALRVALAQEQQRLRQLQVGCHGHRLLCVCTTIPTCR